MATYPTIEEFWAAVREAQGEMAKPAYQMVEIHCKDGSGRTTAHYTLGKKVKPEAGVVRAYWQTISPIVLQHPSGLIRVKPGTRIVLRPLSGAEIGFAAEDIEVFEELKKEAPGLS